jgi:hypothetical protein
MTDALLPGERMIHGVRWIFNADLRNDFIARRAIWQAWWHPPVLADLSDDELHKLETHTFRFDCWVQRKRMGGWPAEGFRVAINGERARRETVERAEAALAAADPANDDARDTVRRMLRACPEVVA